MSRTERERALQLEKLSQEADATRRSPGALERERQVLAAENALLRKQLDDLDDTVAELRALLDPARHDAGLFELNEQLRRDYQDLLRSRTWRAGRAVAAIAAPAIALRGRVPPRRRVARPRTPAAAYAAAVAYGRAWHFPKSGTRAQRPASPLDPLLRAFGKPEIALGAERSRRLVDAIRRLDWGGAASLSERRLSWHERQVVVEIDAVARLVHDEPDGFVWSKGGDPVVVADARCLQHATYRDRGVGLHAADVLRATRKAIGKRALVLLTDAELPALDPDLAELADRTIVTPYAVRDERVALFLALSPMTTSAAPTVPFLAAPGCATVGVVFDFIPTDHEARYLATTRAALQNRARVEALRHYDLLLPISDATAAACRRLLGAQVRTVTTGVADPLHGVAPTPSVRAPFMVVPAGDDTRKNAAAAIAALAEHVRRGGAPLEIVVTGSIPRDLADDLRQLARDLDLPSEALDVQTHVRPDELAGLYEIAELTLVPSRAEGFSLPVAESVLRGAPVVASDVDAHSELIGAGPWLAPATNIASLAAGIAHVREDRTGVLAKQRETLADLADPASVAERIASALVPLLGPALTRQPPSRERGARARVAIVAPFPPHESGVADYTAFTARELARHADVEIYSSAPAGRDESLPVRPISSAPYLDRGIDVVVNVVGNSHFHFHVLDLMSAFGGACISHDASMADAYGYDRGAEWLAESWSTVDRTFGLRDVHAAIHDLDKLPTLGYELIAAHSSPLIVHSRALAARIEAETGAVPVVVPFVPYNLPSARVLDANARREARAALGLAGDELHVATFGLVDGRTKAHDLAVGASALLKSWNIRVRLHVVGDAPPDERRALEEIAADLGVSREVTWHGRVGRDSLERFLLGVDVAVQLRTSRMFTISGALADCLAYGTPTVTTSDLAAEADAPAFVTAVGTPTSSLLLAEAIEEAREWDRDDPKIETARREYLERRSVDSYARGVLETLGIAA